METGAARRHWSHGRRSRPTSNEMPRPPAGGKRKKDFPSTGIATRAGAARYAYTGEIDAWRASRRAAVEVVQAARPLWRFPAFAVTILMCLIMVGNGIRPAEAQQSRPIAKRLVISADAVDKDADFSPDGRSMVFTDWNDSQDLAIRGHVHWKSQTATSEALAAQGFGRLCSSSGVFTRSPADRLFLGPRREGFAGPVAGHGQ